MGAFVWRTEILKIETQELEDRQVELTVEVPEDRVQAAKRSSAKRLSKDARIPGFRPGKAPYEVILSKYGEEVIFEEALEILGQEAYRESLDDAELDPYAPGSLEEIVSRDPLVLRFTVPLVPEVELGDYREIRIPYEESEVTDEAVESMMEELRQRQALIEPVERPAEDSDIVVLDIHGELLDQEDDEDAELVNQDGVSILVDEETDFPFLGIYEHLMGMVEGDEKTVEHTFPEDYAAEDLQNKHASFQLKCSGVKSRLVPEWSDDLAKSIGEFEDLLDLRIKVRESLTEQATQEAETAYAEQVMEMVIEGAQVTYPPIVLENEIDHLMRDLEMRLSSQNLAFDDYLKIEGKNAGVLEALMLNAEGFVAECTGDNIFIVSDKVLRTPPITAGILDGITRHTVIELAREAGCVVREEDLTQYDVYTADECFLTGTAAEVIAVVKVDGRTIGTGEPGPVTKDLLQRFRALTRGK